MSHIQNVYSCFEDSISCVKQNKTPERRTSSGRVVARLAARVVERLARGVERLAEVLVEGLADRVVDREREDRVLKKRGT